MKILLYLEAEKFLRKSGIGRAIYHQKRALDIAGIDYTTNPHEDFDIAHINTYGIKSIMLLFRAKRMGKKVIYHGHSTMEDFRNSFIGSNLLAPIVKKYLTFLYRHADLVITPTDYSKQLITSYGVNVPVVAISNGIDLSKYCQSPEKEQAFKNHFQVLPDHSSAWRISASMRSLRCPVLAAAVTGSCATTSRRSFQACSEATSCVAVAHCCSWCAFRRS